jgi:Carbohydrate esterase, sialic acid-specific acetylesterase
MLASNGGSGIFLSDADTYENLDLNRGSFNEPGDRTLVDQRNIVPGRAAVMLIFGQSNGANSGETPYVPRHRVFNFNLFDGRCYVAKDPLLGTTERRGNFASRMADLLIERGHFDSVVLAPISVGGSRIEDWTSGGVRHRRLQVTIERAFEAGLEFTHLLWHQGETNARYGPDGHRYIDCFMDIHAAVRRYGVFAPLYVAEATLCGETGPVEIIRAAQRAVVNAELGILAGPDTDTIGIQDRFDGCHMAETGLIKHANLWVEALSAAAPAKPQSMSIPA